MLSSLYDANIHATLTVSFKNSFAVEAPNVIRFLKSKHHKTLYTTQCIK